MSRIICHMLTSYISYFIDYTCCIIHAVYSTPSTIRYVLSTCMCVYVYIHTQRESVCAYVHIYIYISIHSHVRTYAICYMLHGTMCIFRMKHWLLSLSIYIYTYIYTVYIHTLKMCCVLYIEYYLMCRIQSRLCSMSCIAPSKSILYVVYVVWNRVYICTHNL